MMPQDDDDDEKEITNPNTNPNPNPSPLPYGMKDTRSSLVKQQAVMQRSHRKNPTFGAINELQRHVSNDLADADDDDDDDDEEMKPRQFPNMDMSSDYANPGASTNGIRL
eukprot:TRINITY_DN5377_c0_g1_i1.p1 TRINITY_DN5377_c0_g1~~TRINITY_DN5377_c0_g1_i1.p1  ORF type:complete len:110 (-),score=48.11 TRINITY_DN5377_c0_g1_i1:81-410(-)